MHIYFIGIGGVGIGPLAQIALDAGYTVSGSDTHESPMTKELIKRGATLSFDQSATSFSSRHHEAPFDWVVYTAAASEAHEQIAMAHELGIKTTKRDELLSHIITEKQLKLIAVAGTHGKTTTTSMIIWLARYFGLPISYSVGASLSWAPSGKYSADSEYFVYECDEFDRNFLAFHPMLSLVTSIEYDHPDTYPTEEDYMQAFAQFAHQSDSVITWQQYSDVLKGANLTLVNSLDSLLRIPGEHNRANASLVMAALRSFGIPDSLTADALNAFPGSSRRFEKVAESIYSDYGHTPTEIAATLQLARELSDDVVLVYQPHQNMRQHMIQSSYTDKLFSLAKEIVWLPTYLSREDESLDVLTPKDLTSKLTATRVNIASLDDALWQQISDYAEQGNLVLCMGAGSIDDWLRRHVAS